MGNAIYTLGAILNSNGLLTIFFKKPIPF
jgi:hypothetical protein